MAQGKARKALDVAAAVAAYERGESIRHIAAELGWSYAGLHGRLRSAGVQMRPRGGRGNRATAAAAGAAND